MMTISVCPACGATVLPKADGRCPACQQLVDEEILDAIVDGADELDELDEVEEEEEITQNATREKTNRKKGENLILDFDRLSRTGWLLLIPTISFLALLMFVLGSAFVGVIVLATIAFYTAASLICGRLGLPIYRDDEPKR
jgi:hypothetical protein